MKHCLFIPLVIFIAFTSCAKIEYVEGAKKGVTKHKSIAIIQPTVYIENCSDLSDEECMAINEVESSALYNELYNQVVLKSYKKKERRLKILSKAKTESALSTQNYDLQDLNDLRRLCDSLDVDALLLSSFDMAQPNSVGEAIGVAVISTILMPGIGTGSSTNFIDGYLVLYDKEMNEEIWFYEHKVSGGLLETKKGVIKSFMRKLTRKLPYF